MFGTLILFLVASAITPECQTGWVNIMESHSNPDLPSYYSKMYLYSGFGMNSLGNFESCKQLQEAKYVLEIYNRIPIVVVALCGPIACTEADYYESPLPIISSTVPASYSVLFPEEYQDRHNGTYSYGAICILVFIGVLVGLSLIATISEYLFPRDKSQDAGLQILLSFSIATNGKSLLTTRAQEGKVDTLELMSGIRVLSIIWVVYGHVCINLMGVTAISNFDSAMHMLEEPIFVLGYGAFYAVDSFFWMSGLLMAYFFVIEVNKAEIFSHWKLGAMYLHRYLRITPVFAACTFFFWAMGKNLGNGPLWFDYERFVGNCEDYWYTNLIYLNNFIPGWDNMCLSQGWYLAADMQMFMVSPIIILLYAKFSKLLGWLIILALCCTNIVLSGVLSHHYSLNPGDCYSHNCLDYFDYYNMRPYARMGSYLLGISCGFILYTYRKHKDTNEIYDEFAFVICKTLEKWYARYASFIVGNALLVVLLYGQYDVYIYPWENDEDEGWARFRIDIFIAFERVTYGIGMSLIFLPMLLGFFKPITRFLSWSPWCILAKFTFVVYLIHLPILQTMLRSQTDVMKLSEYNAIRDTIYFYIVSLGFAVLLVIFVEMPAANLEKIIFPRRNTKDKKSN